MKLFAFADLSLRGQAATVVKPEPPPPETKPAEAPLDSKPVAPQSPPDLFSLSTEADTGFYLRPEDYTVIRLPLEASDPLTRGFEAVFKPEEFKLGRTAKLSCSVLTAIKRKNPLCLINPIFLNVSW
jgi:hypothetical protein